MNAEDFELESNLIGHTSGINCVILSPDSHKIVSCSQDSTLKVWSAQKGHLEHTLLGIFFI
jgi:WD40 repeat protein